ncbi:MFS transporter [Streptomyces sp. NPDC046215]|uniref:MFS transporter n=1 Tax=Streptomyces stramineus TaxID=173861 RepID=A0ABN1B6F6_9ACTN
MQIPVRIPGGPDGRRLLAITFVDRVGSGLWGATAALYFLYVVRLTTAEIGLLLAVSGAVGIAGPPLGGLLADRLPLRPLLALVQVVRALASLALLTTTDLGLLLAFAAAGSLGDRASSVLTKLYATRIAGPERVRYQAINRTAANIGWAVGGLTAAGALTAGTPTVYRALLIGDALSFVATALLTLRCTEPTPSHTVRTTAAPEAGTAPERKAATGPWRDRRYLLYTLGEIPLCLDDSIFKIGLPLWAATATAVPHQAVPLFLVLNNALVVCFQVPFARFGTTPAAARNSLLPLAAVLLAGGAAFAASAVDVPWLATAALALAATAFSVAEMLHATISWELSVALAPPETQGAYLGVHGLAQATQRSVGPLALTGVIAAGPLGWLGLGAGLAAVCCAQRRLVRDRDHPAMSVPSLTVSKH